MTSLKWQLLEIPVLWIISEEKDEEERGSDV